MQTQSKQKSVPRKIHSAEDKAKARRYYLLGLNLHEISKLLDGCPVKTLEKWQNTEQWRKLKQLESIEVKTFDMYQAGYSYKEIAETLKISASTIWRYVRKVEAMNNK